MNFIFMPSLRHIANVRVASMIYNDQEIENIFDEDSAVYETYKQWELVESKMVEKLSPLLPDEHAQGVAKIIRPMDALVVDWKRDHEYLLKHLQPSCSVYLSWNSNGTINRTQTAKNILMNDNIKLKKRFKLACTYFLENEILSLWQKMEEITRFFLKSGSSDFESSGMRLNAAVAFWVKRLDKEDIRPWRETVGEYFKNPIEEAFSIHLRVSSFFHLLSWESKVRHIESFEKDAHPVHTDDWEGCLNGLSETERVEIFSYSENATQFLRYCLKWPFRPLFLNMAKEAFNYLPDYTLEELMNFVFRSYSDKQNEDYHLFEELWHMSPPSFKDSARENKIFLTGLKLLFCIDKYLKPIQKFVNKCYFG